MYDHRGVPLLVLCLGGCSFLRTTTADAAGEVQDEQRDKHEACKDVETALDRPPNMRWCL